MPCASARRPAATILILTAWNVLAGLWLGDESIRSRRGEVDGLDSAVLGCLLTAVLAAVGISRNLAEPGQVVLIAAAGVAGALTSYAVWRLRGSTGAPVGAALVAIVAGLCIALPLTLYQAGPGPCPRSPSPARSAGPWSRTAPSRCRARAPPAARGSRGRGRRRREGVAAAATAWGAGDLPAEALARRLFEVEPAPAPAPTAAIASDRRDGFYRWWVFVRTGDGDPAAALRRAL